MDKQKVYNPVIDVLRIVAILAVIGIHTSTRILEVVKFDISGYIFVFIFNQAIRFAVPLFFLISGFVLELNYRHANHYISFLKRRVSRIVIPYLFWSIIYYYFVYTIHTINLPHTILTGDASYHLYFIPSIIIFYLLFPILHKYQSFFLSRNTIIILGFVQVLLVAYTYYILPLPFYNPISIALLNYFMFVFGMYISKNSNTLLLVKNDKRILIGLILAVIWVITEGYFIYIHTHNYLAIYTQWRPSILLYTILLFIYTYRKCMNIHWNIKLIKQISHLSFFVFFIHVLVLELFWRYIGKLLFAHIKGSFLMFLFTLVIFIIIALVSFLLAYLIHKIPKVSAITG